MALPKKIPHFNNKLDAEFRRLGFEDIEKMITRVIVQDQLMYLGLQEKLQAPAGNGIDTLLFSFVVAIPEGKTSSLEYIHTSLTRKNRETGPGYPTEQVYWKMDGFVSKTQMITDVLTLERKADINIDRVRDIIEAANQFKQNPVEKPPNHRPGRGS